MPDRIAARLRAELDAVRPGVPNPVGARYRAPRAARPWRPRRAGYALAVAIGAAVMAGAATLTSGSPNPEVWTMQVVGGIHRLQEPPPPPASPSVAPTPTEAVKTVVVPAPPTGEGGHGQPGGRPVVSAPPEMRESPRPQPSSDSHQGPAAPTPTPSSDSQGGGGDGGGDSSAARPSPSPSTSHR